MDQSFGILFIVATPIGNLNDITFRAVQVLKEASLIAAEDTRRTRGLLTFYGITTPTTSYHDHNKKQQGEKLTRLLISGKSIALVTDAGTPGIADPGYYLVNLAIDHGVKVIPIPGASAMVTALSAAGLPTDRFAFEGYVPRKSAARKKFIQALKDEERTLILYESPYRIMTTLQDLFEICGDRWVVVARELTKVYEEFVRGALSWVLENWQGKKMKGEFTILVGSADYSEKRITKSTR
ncbi:MAG: 16S rRNA (cytidine(1402)-2'-O)-methyltransferase [Deltaproteobacteria bacterium]|nr:16S rRNA (cytidine(1402)-2'-O)-methyltransferase [Deltaproteobacteria bacterium]